MKNTKLNLMVLTCLALAVASSGCKKKIFDRVTVTPSENLEVIRVSVLFAKSVSIDLSGGFALKDYGNIFLNAATSSTPFEVGFNLNTAIVNDQDYIRLTPTEVFPNGMPIGIGHAIAQVNSPAPISPQFNAYGYVDVLNRSWLGVAATLNIDIVKKIPKDYAIRKVFLRDKDENPTLVGAAYGPFTKPDGTSDYSAGVAVLANVRSLLNRFENTSRRRPIVLKGEFERIERLK